MRVFKPNIRFDRNELAGAFGDIGTDFPLLVGIILASGMSPVGALVMFGALQVLTGLIYGIPMPVQPLKAMAVIVITQKLGGDILCGAGLAIGILMLILTLSGLIDVIARIVPLCVVRGIQFGLGMQLATLALKNYIPADGLMGYGVAFLCFVSVILFFGNRKYPPALFVITIGVIYAVFFKLNLAHLVQGFGFQLPKFQVPTVQGIMMGFLLLSLPQIPLSIGNSILATQQTAKDLFPEHPPLTIRKISLTYSIMNLIAPFFGGIPVCHGAGGMAGHYAFGARTGGAPIIYGTIYLILGLFLGGVFGDIIHIFPKAILGVLLFFEGMALMKLMFGTPLSKKEIMIMLMVGLISAGLPYGYMTGLIIGTVLVNAKSLSK
ncbi:MAG: putative sulfate/molybdate transporter [Candidatus Omnitrophica bacterium]|nr:putative sulfate/molybdate transporter [Candidatus Omnitrophota bacterium]